MLEIGLLGVFFSVKAKKLNKRKKCAIETLSLSIRCTSSMEWKPKQRGLYNSSAVKGKMFQKPCSLFHLKLSKNV